MTTATDYTQLSTELQVTFKRVQTIYSKLFGDLEIDLSVARPHIEAVVKRIKKSGETVSEACDNYKFEIQKQHQKSTQPTAKSDNKPGKGSLNHLLESDRAATLKLTQKRYTALIKESNNLLADWLSNGLPEGQLDEDLENSIFDSSDDVLDALTSVIDVVGNYQHPQALKPSCNSIAALLLPSQNERTPDISTANGKKDHK